MKNTVIVDHPLVQDALTHLRDKKTSREDFRSYGRKISSLLIINASADLLLTPKTITTPLTKTTAYVVNTPIVLVTILRAGLAMLGPAIKLFPDAPIGLAGLRRDEKTAVAKEYYWQMPEITKETTVFLLDPMLATGGSIVHVLKKVQGAKEVRVVTIISAPEGIAAIHDAFPAIRITTGAVDERLNDKKYIVPGLGDFGDRYFGTE